MNFRNMQGENMGQPIEKLNEFCGIAQVEYRGKAFYCVYIEEDPSLLKDEILDGYLGKAISKGKSIEEALKEAVKNLSTQLNKYSTLINSVRDSIDNLNALTEDPNLDYDSCGLDLCLLEYLEEFKNRKPTDEEERKMLENESPSKVWLTEKNIPYLNPYP